MAVVKVNVEQSHCDDVYIYIYQTLEREAVPACLQPINIFGRIVFEVCDLTGCSNMRSLFI